MLRGSGQVFIQVFILSMVARKASMAFGNSKMEADSKWARPRPNHSTKSEREAEPRVAPSRGALRTCYGRRQGGTTARLWDRPSTWCRRMESASRPRIAAGTPNCGSSSSGRCGSDGKHGQAARPVLREQRDGGTPEGELLAGRVEYAHLAGVPAGLQLGHGHAEPHR